MKTNEFIKLINSKLDTLLSGAEFYIVPRSYACAGLVDNSGQLIIAGYFPYKIIGLKVKGKKIKLVVSIINKCGYTYQHNNWAVDGTVHEFELDRELTFFRTEAEAIQECHERNNGKKGPGMCHEITMNKNSKYNAPNFY